MRSLPFILAASLGFACTDDMTCTRELRFPLTIRVTSPQGLSVDSVTVSNLAEAGCSLHSDEEDAASAENYHCSEQGGGNYRIKVTSGDLTWRSSVELASDGCHVTDNKVVEVVLDPDKASPK